MKTKVIIQAIVGVALLYGGYAIWRRIKAKDDEQTNFDGSGEMVIAENNYPYGQYFANREDIRVESLPFYRRNRGTYKSYR